MSYKFQSAMADELQAFIRFKRGLGFRYNRSEFTLMSFDRFLIHQGTNSVTFERQVLSWLGSRPGRKGLSVFADMATIREFWGFLRRRYPRKYKQNIPWPKLPSRSNFTPFVLRPSQIRKLLKNINNSKKSAYSRILIRTVFLVLYCTGLRFGELARLRIRDVDLKTNTLFISESKGRSRWVPIHPTLGKQLINYSKRTGIPERSIDKPFFVRKEGQHLSVGWISDTLRELLRNAGLKSKKGRTGPRPYDLRHSFAVHRLTRWYRQGVDLHGRLPWLSAYMGHVNWVGTETYLTATPELLAVASSRFQDRYDAAKSLE